MKDKIEQLSKDLGFEAGTDFKIRSCRPGQSAVLCFFCLDIHGLHSLKGKCVDGD